ncbi:kelch-like protein 24 [Branchiostoma floridae]|uniref:Kelch-like protein 24 n=1 Tax=Branchiostoma floridae TaxID=7739 RepID=A0A9J7L667_BRAFL|nr:kelch-like protein 24 [Branchiostoma floridae]XP_035676842.1 kelch-like protein 24 [Branchiostoma floridae]XP_035676843.1 kelch-like protein 24 [Branchiostoma floridae]
MDEDSCPTSKIVDGGYAAWFFKELQKMRSEGLLVDVTLSAEGREIPCHRVVLATVNHYFRSMFSGSLSETKKDKIEMGGVSAESLQQLVDFAYTSKVDITEENVQPLFEAADMLQFHGVYGTCELFLEDRINEESCLGIWAQADRVSCTSLSEKAKIWALKWFEELCTTEEFLQLPVHLLKTYISDEGLLAKEEQILEAIMLWVKHDLKQREGHLKELLKCVCFSSLDQGYLKKILKKDKVLAKLPGIKQLTKSQSTHETPRHILQQDMLVLGGNWLVPHGTGVLRGKGPVLYSNSYMYRLGLDCDCIDRSPLPEPFQESRGLAACVVDGDVIMTGGLETPNQAWRYRPSLNSWTKLGCLKRGRFNHGMAVLEGQVYVVGGSREVRSPDIIDRLSEVEVYNEKTNRWRKVAPLQVSVSSFGITTCGGKIYVFGGAPYLYEGNDLMENETDAVQVYDPSQNEWSYDMHLPVKASCIQACTVDSKMYIVGGYLECVVCIDPEEEKLHLLADRLFPWKQCSATVCGGEIYITGGRVHQLVHSDNGTQRQIENYSKVQCYNVKNDIMVLGKEMPKPLYGHCTVTIAKT